MVCRTEEGVIDMGEVYYNFWYQNRSFVVVNEAAVAMEFLLSSSLDHNDSTELNFSLANTSLKRFSSVTVDAKSRLVCWLLLTSSWEAIFFSPFDIGEMRASEELIEPLNLVKTMHS
jgi:hypothetical protein